MLFKLKDTEVLEITPIYKDNTMKKAGVKLVGANG